MGLYFSIRECKGEARQLASDGLLLLTGAGK